MPVKLVILIGELLGLLAIIDIVKKPISILGKVICIVLMVLFPWIGLAVYYLYAKNHLTEWFK